MKMKEEEMKLILDLILHEWLQRGIEMLGYHDGTPTKQLPPWPDKLVGLRRDLVQLSLDWTVLTAPKHESLAAQFIPRPPAYFEHILILLVNST